MLGGAGAGVDVQLGVPDARSITVVESSHRIDFPNGIRVTLEADAPADVQSVRLFYTIGSQPTQIYTYPSVIRVSETFDAQFTIRTTGDSFIPQGVDIEYFYVFIDSEGTEIESNHYTFEYLDPRYRWQRLELDDYILLWHDRSAARVRAVAEDVFQSIGAGEAAVRGDRRPPSQGSAGQRSQGSQPELPRGKPDIAGHIPLRRLCIRRLRHTGSVGPERGWSDPTS